MESFAKTKFPKDITFNRFRNNSLRTLRESFTTGLTNFHFGCPEEKFDWKKIEKILILLDLLGVWANNFRALGKNFELSSEKSAKSGDGYTLFVYGTFQEETFCMEKTIKNLGFWADTMFTPIKSFSAGLLKLHFMFSGN